MQIYACMICCKASTQANGAYHQSQLCLKQHTLQCLQGEAIGVTPPHHIYRFEQEVVMELTGRNCFAFIHLHCSCWMQYQGRYLQNKTTIFTIYDPLYVSTHSEIFAIEIMGCISSTQNLSILEHTCIEFLIVS